MSENVHKAIMDLYNRAVDVIARLYVRCGVNQSLLEGIEITLLSAKASLVTALEYDPVNVPEYMYSFLNAIRSSIVMILEECREPEQANVEEAEDMLKVIDGYMKDVKEIAVKHRLQAVAETPAVKPQESED